MVKNYLFGLLCGVFMGTMIGALLLAPYRKSEPISTLPSIVVATPVPLPTVTTTPTPAPAPPPAVALEWRCIQGRVYADYSEQTPGMLMQLGEVALCGYDLQGSNMVGPSLDAWVRDGDGLKIRPIGVKEERP